MKKISVIIVILLPLLIKVAFSERIEFNDIASHWAKSSITMAVQQGLVKGYSDATFRPDQPVTEAEFMAFMIRSFPNAQKDSDAWVKSHSVNEWTDSVAAMALRYNFPLNDLNKPITRLQVAHIIAGANGLSYDDNGAIAYLYDKDLSHGRTAQTIKGYEGAGTLTRAEAVSFMMNLRDHGMTAEMKSRPEKPTWRTSVGKYSSPTLVALGDSISFGLYLDNGKDPSEKAFPAIIAADQHYAVNNLGVNGWTTGDLLQALNTNRYQQGINAASVITLDIGSNDLIQGSNEILAKLKQDPSYRPSEDEVFKQVIVAEEKLYKDLPIILQKIHELTDAPVILYTLYNPFPNIAGLEYIHQLNEQVLFPINQLIKDTPANDPKVLLADAQQAFVGSELKYVRVLAADIHPTESGQRELARIGLEALKNKE